MKDGLKYLIVTALVVLSVGGVRKINNTELTDCPLTSIGDTVASLPYYTHGSVVIGRGAGDTTYLHVLGGYGNDSITSNSVRYNSVLNNYNLSVIPPLPQKLAEGFGFRLKDSIYYGGGYTTAWASQVSPVNDTLYDITFTSSSTGYIGTHGRVLKTTNSGTTWTAVTLDTTREIRSLKFNNQFTGFALGTSSDTNSLIFRTTNSGTSWIPGALSGKMNKVDFSDSLTGWTAGNLGKMHRTTTGGNSWATITTGSAFNINSISANGPFSLWAACDSGKVLHTTNGGAAWSTQSVTSVKLNAIKFINSSTGFTAGDAGRFYRTTNGGTNWQQVNLGMQFSFKDIEYINNSVLTVVGEKGFIFCSSDLGVSWTRKKGVTPNSISAVAGDVGSGLATIIGSGKTIIRSTLGVFDPNISKKLYKLNLNNPGAGWALRDSLPVPIGSVTNSCEQLNDSLAYVTGGKTVNNVTLRNVYRYNSRTNKWTACSPMPDSLSDGGLAVISDTSMYLAGGRNSASISNKIYNGKIRIDIGQPDTISWTFLMNYPDGPVYGMGASGIKGLYTAFFVSGSSTSLLDAMIPTAHLINNGKLCSFPGLIARPVVTSGTDGSGEPGLASPGDVLDTLQFSFYTVGGQTDTLGNTTNLNQRFTFTDKTVGIQNIGTGIPDDYKLFQNYPNPFNPSTMILFDLPKSEYVSLKVYDITGKEIAELVNGSLKAGSYRYTFNSRGLSSGIYILRMKAGSYINSKRMTFIK